MLKLLLLPCSAILISSSDFEQKVRTTIEAREKAYSDGSREVLPLELDKVAASVYSEEGVNMIPEAFDKLAKETAKEHEQWFFTNEDRLLHKLVDEVDT